MNSRTLLCASLVLFFLGGGNMTAFTDETYREIAQKVVARELAFAERAQAIDPRDAFLEFFSADALMFRPGPVPARERLQMNPPWGINLQWWPVEVAVSVDGCLAYSTGPVESRRSKKSKNADGFGTFFSIWRKNAENAWEVAADLGTDTPALFAERSTPVKVRLPLWRKSVKPDVPLLIVDNDFAGSAAEGLTAALRPLASRDYRLLLPGEMPIIGCKMAISHLHDGSCSWKVEGEIVAASGDFGATYGHGEGGYTAGKFGYLRVWQRDEQGHWRIMAEAINIPRN